MLIPKALRAGRVRTFLDSYDVARTAAELLRDGLSLLGFLFPWAFGIFQFERAERTVVSISEMEFPARLTACLVSAAILGAGLGFAAMWLTRRDSDLTFWVAALLAGAWGLMLVVAVEALSRTGGGAWPEFSLFLMLSLALSALLLTFQLSARVDMVNRDRVRDRSAIVLVYVAAAVGAAMLVRAGNLG